MSDTNKPPKKPFGAEVVARVTGAFAALAGKSNAFFGAGEPPAPNVTAAQAEGVRGRMFDFPVGVNQHRSPRQGEGVTYAELRALADSCDILRLVIESRKDQMAKMKFSIRPVDTKQKADERCREVQSFFRMPDGENSWDTWVRMLLEDMFVLDAATIYPWLHNDGTPYRFELLDGATIKRVLDDRGRTPEPPNPAYQQVMKGAITANYTRDELVYAPRNRRTNKAYGFSPVEQVVMTVNLALRRTTHQLQFYTEGSAPDLLFNVPPEWSTAQIKEFNDYWQSMFSGNTAERRKAQFVPAGVKPINTKDGVLTDKFDEWLARIICYAFSVSHQPFVAEVNRATAETAQKQALEEGLHPIMQWVKGVCENLIVRYFGYTDLEFAWEDQDSVSPEVKARIQDMAVRNGTMTINEVRAESGYDSVEGGDLPQVLTMTGYVPIVPKTADPYDYAPDPDHEPEPPKDAAEKRRVGTGSAIVRKAKMKKIDRDRAAVGKHIVALSAVMRGVFATMVDGIAAQLSGLFKADGADDLEFDEWVEQWEGSIEKRLIKVVKSGASEAYLQLAIDSPETFKLANKDAVEWAKGRAAELVGMVYQDGKLVPNPNAAMNILESTRELIRDDVTRALDAGLTNDELATMLKGHAAFSDARAEKIARTETAIADVKGSLIMYEDSGVVEGKRWLSSDNCCDDCAALDGVQVGIDDSFPLSGGDGPPLHPQCRCDILPVVVEETETE